MTPLRRADPGSGKISCIARLLPLLLIVWLSPGCAPADFCQPLSGSEVTLLVRPPARAGDESGNPFVFSTIQAALDATSGRQSTVCVSAGRYEERLTVPPWVHLLGEGTDLVQVRPPQSRFVPHAAFVDRVLLTLAPEVDAPVRVEAVDIGAAAVCADQVGPGTSLLRDVVLHDCGIGLRGSAGATLVEASVLRGHFLWGVHVDGLDRLAVRDGTTLTGNGFGALPAPFQPVFEGAWQRASELEGVSAGGVLRASDVADLEIEDVVVSGNAFEDGSLLFVDTTWVVRDSEIAVGAVEVGDQTGLAGTGPTFLVSGGDGLLRRTAVRTGGQELVRVAGEPALLTIESAAWDGRGADAVVTPSAIGPAIDFDAGGTLDLEHVTLLGGGGVGLRIGADTDLAVVNSIVWGHDDGAGLRVASDADVTGYGVAWSLFEDGDLEGEDLVEPADPDLDDAFVPAADSPARCEGQPGGSAVDLLGGDRPFEAGKAPDVGAVERQEGCP